MAECRHGLEVDECALCGERMLRAGRSTDRSRSGMSFALVLTPSLRPDTFLHLNVQGDSWKLRDYRAADMPPVEIDQAGPRSGTGSVHDLAALQIVAREPYPHSSTRQGESVENSAYWHVEIAEVNARHGLARHEPGAPVA